MPDIYQITATGDRISLDGFCEFPIIPKGWWPLPMAAEAGASVPAINTWPVCSETGGFATLLLDLLTPDEADVAGSVRHRSACRPPAARPDAWLAASANQRTTDQVFRLRAQRPGQPCRAAARRPRP